MSARARELGALLRAGHTPTVRLVRGALRAAGGDVTAAAAALGVPRVATLHEWLRDLSCLEGAMRQGGGAPRKPIGAKR